MLTKEVHNQFIERVNKVVDKSGKDNALKLSKVLKVRAIIQDPKLMRTKFLSEAVKQAIPAFNSVKTIGDGLLKVKMK